MGTERHDARRIDNQLRGRSGRQGDPGETQFFVSLEDSLMRVFASETLKSMMGRLGMKEDEAIEMKIVNKALESAQEKIEGFNFDSRKHVLEFDDIINLQRKTVYGRRRNILLGDIDIVQNEINNIIEGIDFESIADSADQLQGKINSKEQLLEIISNKEKDFGKQAFYEAVRMLILQTIDMYWVEHLEVMDYTRSSVNLRAYGQRDPLVEYKKEGTRLFREMQSIVASQVVKILPHIIPAVNGVPVASAQNSDLKEVHENAQTIGSGDGSYSGDSSISKKEEVGRNDLCPCGSGKKYKKCHGK